MQQRLLLRGGLGLVLMLTAALIAVQMARPAPARAEHRPGIYRGTHAAGGTVTFQTGPSGLLTFAATDIPGDGCFVTEQAVRYGGSGLPIVDHAFVDDEEFSLTPSGRFLPDGRAEGTFLLFPSSTSTCRATQPIAWTAEFSGEAPATRTPTPTRTRTPVVTRTPTPPTGNRTALYLGEATGGAPVEVVTVINDGEFFMRSVRIGALPPALGPAVADTLCEPRAYTLTGVEGLFRIEDNRVEVRTPGNAEDGSPLEVVITARFGQNGFTGTVAWEFLDRPDCSTPPVTWLAALVQGTGKPIVPATEPVTKLLR